MRQAVTNFILKAYTLSKGKALAGQKVAQQSVHTFATLRQVGFVAILSIFLASSFFYISSRVHARPHAGNANR
jgi:hypothetical protein